MNPATAYNANVDEPGPRNDLQCDDDRDPEDIVVHDGPPRRFPRVVAEPVERRTRVTWCVGGKEVLHDRGDGTYEVARWPHASIEDLERLFYVIGELLTITQPKPHS